MAQVAAPAAMAEAAQSPAGSTKKKCPTHPDLRRKLAALLLGVAEQFDVASNIDVMQVWLPDAADGAAAATNNAALQLRADADLLLLGDAALADFRAQR